MTIKVEVILKSSSDYCPDLASVQCRYPRFIHSEVMTHRVFSRNSSSSRAIPVDRLIEDVMADPATPVYWGAEQPGMQAGDELESGEDYWLAARDMTIGHALYMKTRGYHKQIVNRLLEPYQHINVLITATEWDNFFKLRDHEDAQPEIQVLARAIKEAIQNAPTTKLSRGDWHLPYITDDERGKYDLDQLKQISSARCASVSYKTVDGKPMTPERALRVFNKLTGDPLHASPFEHIATPMQEDNKLFTRNFTGWAQWRSFLEVGK